MRVSVADFHARCPGCHKETYVRQEGEAWRFVEHGCATRDLDAGPLLLAWARAQEKTCRWLREYDEAYIHALEEKLANYRRSNYALSIEKEARATDIAALVESLLNYPKDELG